MKTFTVALTLLLAINPSLVLARDTSVVTDVKNIKPPEAPPTWVGSAELGMAHSSGNTDAQTAFGKLWVKREINERTLAMGGSFLFGKSDGQKSADRVEAFATTGRRFNERTYFFSNIRGEIDDFSSYDYQAIGGVGIGRQLIKTDGTQMTVELGPSVRRSKSTTDSRARNELIARSKMDLNHKLNDGTALYAHTLIEAGTLNRFAQNNAGVQVKMTEKMALKAGVEVRYNSDVLPGVRHTDTLSTLNLQFGF